MSTLSMRFDPIEYAKQLRGAGVSQELVTKNDLKKDLAELKLELIKWLLGTGVATVVALAGIIKLIH